MTGAEGAGKGAGIGAALGGVAGLLAGLGLLAIPGFGPVVAAGWLASTAAVAAAGARGAAAFIGALTRAPASTRTDANAYAEGVRRGGTLVTARVPDTDRSRAEMILDRAAVNIRDRATHWQRNGWNRFDPAAPAYTADEIRRERAIYRTRVQLSLTMENARSLVGRAFSCSKATARPASLR